MSENPILRNLVPHLSRKRAFTPTNGGRITLTLPGELVIALVERVVSDDLVVGRIENVPMGRGHLYKKDDIVPCRRAVDTLLQIETWEVVAERELPSAAEVARQMLQEQDRAGGIPTPPTAPSSASSPYKADDDEWLP